MDMLARSDAFKFVVGPDRTCRKHSIVYINRHFPYPIGENLRNFAPPPVRCRRKTPLAKVIQLYTGCVQGSHADMTMVSGHAGWSGLQKTTVNHNNL